ncbi:uncharacterized protein LOC135370293 [Ornithodoros turicata]|uniref:uncharacterized protein LOC135370293 n=1 Tax=Ornithodoros turicata TaxID=34597 RepID=UPI003139AE44
MIRFGVLVSMLMGFLYQASKVVEQYLSYPSAVDVRFEGTETLLYPGLSICVTNWISRTKLCHRYPEYCNLTSDNMNHLRRFLLTAGNLGEIAHNSDDVLQIGFITPAQYFFEFYLNPNVTKMSYCRLPTHMCYTTNWRSDPKINTVHQNVLAFEMTLLFAWPEDDLVVIDPFEMDLGFHDVDTNTAGSKHAIVFNPSGEFLFGITQEGTISLAAPYDTMCHNYTERLKLPSYEVLYTKEMCYEECRKDITKSVCGCVPNDYAYRNHISEKVCDMEVTAACVQTDSRSIYTKTCTQKCRTACRETVYKTTQSAWKQDMRRSDEDLYYVKVRAMMTSRSVGVLQFIPLLTGTQVLGVVGGYLGFWMGMAIYVTTADLAMFLFEQCRLRAKSRLTKAEIWTFFKVTKISLYIGSLAACSVSVYRDFNSYRHYYTAVTYEDNNIRGVQFPSVTVCSFEAVNFTRMCEEYGKFNSCVTANFDTTVGNDIVAMKYVINFTFPAPDMLFACSMTFMGETCEDFVCDRLWQPTYTYVKTGVCYVLDLSKAPQVVRCQEQYKYKLRFRVRADTKNPPSEGLLFSALAHARESYTSGIVHTFRFQATMKYIIPVSQTEFVSLPPPYETRCIDYKATSDETLYGDKEIQEEECSEFCVAQKWLDTCSCISKMYAVKHRMKGHVCEYVPHMRCIDALIAKRWFRQCQDLCTRGCKDTRYKGLMFQTGKIEKYIKYENAEADLTVLMGSTKRRIVRNRARMTIGDFLLYLSGHVSMWLGVALINVTQYALLAFNYVRHYIKSLM